MSLVIDYWIGDVQDSQGVSAYIVSGGALNSIHSLRVHCSALSSINCEHWCSDGRCLIDHWAERDFTGLLTPDLYMGLWEASVVGGTVNVSSWGLIDHCTGGHWSPRPRKNLPPDFRHPDLLYSWRCFCSGNAVTMAQCELCLIVLAGNVLFHLLTHIFVRNVETVLSLYLYCSAMCCVRSSVLLLLRDWFYFVWQLQAGLVYR